jgi:VWFA-related protein
VFKGHYPPDDRRQVRRGEAELFVNHQSPRRRTAPGWGVPASHAFPHEVSVRCCSLHDVAPYQFQWLPPSCNIAASTVNISFSPGVAVGLLALIAQQAPVPPFTLATELVQVEAVVSDDEGRPIDDLAASDFALTVDGKGRAIVSAAFVRASEGNRLTAQEPGESTAQAGQQHGRLIVIAVDEGNISAGAGRNAVAAAGRLIDRLQPADRLALLTIPSGPAVDFTRNHAQVRAALGRLVGRSSPTRGQFGMDLTELFAFDVGPTPGDRQKQEQIIRRECPPTGGAYCREELRAEANQRVQEITERSSATIRALSTLLPALGGLPGPKTLMLISEELIARPDGRDTAAFSSVAQQAAAARVALYSVLLDTQGVDVETARPSRSGSGDQLLREDGLRTITSLSGGQLFKAVGRSDGVFERIARELSGQYLIAFDVLAGDRDDKAHRIRLTTSRRGVAIHARAEFVVPSAARQDARMMRGLLSSPFHVNTLALRVGTYVLQDTQASKVRILLSVEAPDAVLARPATIAYQLTTGNRVVGEDARTIEAQQAASSTSGPLSWVAFRNLSQGAYTLKVSITGDEAHVGSVTQLVGARLHLLGPLATSDLLATLAAPPGSGPFAAPVEVTGPEPQLTVGIEVYGRARNRADAATVRFDVTTRQSPAVVASATAVLTPSGADDRRFARATVPLAQLPPGDYLVRGVVMLRGAIVGTVSRPFRRTQPQP